MIPLIWNQKQTKNNLKIQRADWWLSEVGGRRWEKWVKGVKGIKEKQTNKLCKSRSIWAPRICSDPWHWNQKEMFCTVSSHHHPCLHNGLRCPMVGTRVGIRRPMVGTTVGIRPFLMKASEQAHGPGMMPFIMTNAVCVCYYVYVWCEYMCQCMCMCEVWAYICPWVCMVCMCVLNVCDTWMCKSVCMCVGSCGYAYVCI